MNHVCRVCMQAMSSILNLDLAQKRYIRIDDEFIWWCGLCMHYYLISDREGVLFSWSQYCKMALYLHVWWSIYLFAWMCIVKMNTSRLYQSLMLRPVSKSCAIVLCHKLWQFFPCFDVNSHHAFCELYIRTVKQRHASQSQYDKKCVSYPQERKETSLFR